MSTSKILFVGFRGAGLLIREELREHAGYQVKIVLSPEKAKSILSGDNHGFSLLISGTRIQDVDDAGVELIKWVKSERPELKCVLASVFQENEPKAAEAGADAFWHAGSDYLEILKKLVDELFSREKPRRLNILLADERLSIRLLAEEDLPGKTGHEVTVVSSLKEVIENLLDGEPFDLIFIGHNLVKDLDETGNKLLTRLQTEFERSEVYLMDRPSFGISFVHLCFDPGYECGLDSDFSEIKQIIRELSSPKKKEK